MELEPKKIGERINIALKKKGMRKADFKRDLEFPIAKSSLSEYTNGNRIPSLYTIAVIAKKLGVTIDWSCFGDGIEDIVEKTYSSEESLMKCFTWLYDRDSLGSTKDTYTFNPGRECLIIKDDGNVLLDLYKRLNDFKEHQDTHKDPLEYKKQLIESYLNRLKNPVDEYSIELSKKKSKNK